MSSNPVTITSSGTEMPSACNWPITPRATTSDAHTIASGIAPPARIIVTASFPNFVVKRPRMGSCGRMPRSSTPSENAFSRLRLAELMTAEDTKRTLLAPRSTRWSRTRLMPSVLSMPT